MLFNMALKNGNLISIDEVESGLKCNCFCPVCNSQLVARKGEKKVHHFAHYNSSECESYGESMLHLVAKKIIEENKYIMIPSFSVKTGNYSERKKVKFENREDLMHYIGGSGLSAKLFAENVKYGRPPLDPVNSLLSFGYALLLGEVVLALREAGLHTGLGFLHEPSRRREALALDLMELFRQSIVDRFILRIVNLKMFKENDFFVADEEGVRLNPEAMPRFFAAWEEQLGNKDEAEAPCGMRAFIRREVKALKREICSGEKWQPQKRIS